MKQVLILVAFLFFGITTTVAQGDFPDGPPPREHHDRAGRPDFPKRMDHQERMEDIVSRLKEQVNITSAQEKQIRAILTETTAKIEQIEETMRPEMEAVKTELKELKTSDLSGEEKKQRMRAIRDKNRPTMEQFKEQLNEIRKQSKSKINDVLTTEQKAALYELRGDQKEEWKSKNKSKRKVDSQR